MPTYRNNRTSRLGISAKNRGAGIAHSLVVDAGEIFVAKSSEVPEHYLEPDVAPDSPWVELVSPSPTDDEL